MMKKSIFSKEEAQIVAFDTPPSTFKLQLHQWVKSGDLIRLKKGLYAFADAPLNKVEVARFLYSPCYVSLEYALNLYGIIPDVPFSMTLVTTKATREFNTPLGEFVYRKIKKEAFFGYDPETLMAEREKALLDFLYLNSRHFFPDPHFWRELRLENLATIDFDKAFNYAEKFGKTRLITLLKSVKEYAELG